MANTEVVNASVDVQWEILKNNSAFLKKRRGFPAKFSSEKFNLKGVNIFSSSGLVQPKGVDIRADFENKALVLTTKRGKAITGNPCEVPVAITLKKDARRTLKSVKSIVKKHNPRQANIAVLRASHLLRAIKPAKSRYGKSTVKTEACDEGEAEWTRINCSTGQIHLSKSDVASFGETSKLSVQNCSEVLLDPFVFTHLKNLNTVEFSASSSSLLLWQAFADAEQVQVNLSGLEVACDCKNRWLSAPFAKGVAAVFNLAKLSPTVPLQGCALEACPEADAITADQKVVSGSEGAPLTLSCFTNGVLQEQPPGAEPFEWAFEEQPRRHALLHVTIRNRSLEARIESASAARDLGLVFCKCWQCALPAFDVIEVQIPTNLSLSVHEYPDMFQVVLHGFPLDNVNVSITRLADNRSETHRASSLQMMYFDGSLGLHSEGGHSSFFVKYFSVKLRECSHCEHRLEAGDYVLRFCSTDSCAEAVVFLSYPKHPVVIPPTLSPQEDGVRIEAHALHPLLNVVVGVLAFLSVGLCTLLAVVFAKRRLVKKGWEIQRRISRAPTDRTDETSIRLEDTSSAGYSTSGYIIRHVPEIERADLQLREKLGQGAYGEVYAAEWSGTRSSPMMRVAVKTLRNDVAFDAEMDAEAAMLSRLDHENVVRLYGMCRASEAPTMLVFELMNLGDLKTYLRDRQPRAADYSQFPPALNASELNNIVLQIATGLAYIHSQQIVHRDLAARNCLIAGQSDLRVCEAAFRPSITVKISDFGMSRRLYSQSQYYRMGSQTMLPVRWLPPECLNDGRFSHQSDMWSFGLTLWEVFSYGRVPFGDLSNNEVLSAVCSGIRPNRPRSCPQEMFDIMESCWKSAPSERLSSEDALVRVTMAQ
ncbi:hypothetical protein QR680_017280 [Steinernema hermaphroditum]|uniref:Protein kinase domain-containing protein n=1 Tax=Steinernema hermaphroditum TaxID=289476 RepID=A0AA39HF02_9BILA|nr:hypothetical protein QR680_017280 [Steinernema hermaphroditum]